MCLRRRAPSAKPKTRSMIAICTQCLCMSNLPCPRLKRTSCPRKWAKRRQPRQTWWTHLTWLILRELHRKCLRLRLSKTSHRLNFWRMENRPSPRIAWLIAPKYIQVIWSCRLYPLLVPPKLRTITKTSLSLQTCTEVNFATDLSSSYACTQDTWPNLSNSSSRSTVPKSNSIHTIIRCSTSKLSSCNNMTARFHSSSIRLTANNQGTVVYFSRCLNPITNPSSNSRAPSNCLSTLPQRLLCKWFSRCWLTCRSQATISKAMEETSTMQSLTITIEILDHRKILIKARRLGPRKVEAWIPIGQVETTTPSY